MKQRRYNVGFDVGLNSLGFAAIEIDEQGMPIRILKAASEIHDGGVDPNTQKTGDSRRSQAGIARRTRRMRRRRKARLERLDKTLTKLGFPIVNESSLHGFDVWKIRALAASGFIEDDNPMLAYWPGGATDAVAPRIPNHSRLLRYRSDLLVTIFVISCLQY